jgi:hypothetical protein
MQMGRHLAPTAERMQEKWDRVTGTALRGVWHRMKNELLRPERQDSDAVHQRRIGRRADGQSRHPLLRAAAGRCDRPAEDSGAEMDQAASA